MLEVFGVEVEDLATPASGCSAVCAEAAGVDAAVLVADDLAAIGLLGCVFDVTATAFEDHDALALSREFHGEADAGSARTNDADLRAIVRRWFFAEKIADHRTASFAARIVRRRATMAAT